MPMLFNQLAEVTPITTADFQSVMDALTAQFSVSTIVGVIALVTGACVGFAFMWWGVNFLKAKIMKAVKKGKV